MSQSPFCLRYGFVCRWGQGFDGKLHFLFERCEWRCFGKLCSAECNGLLTGEGEARVAPVGVIAADVIAGVADDEFKVSMPCTSTSSFLAFAPLRITPLCQSSLPSPRTLNSTLPLPMVSSEWPTPRNCSSFSPCPLIWKLLLPSPRVIWLEGWPTQGDGNRPRRPRL